MNKRLRQALIDYCEENCKEENMSIKEKIEFSQKSLEEEWGKGGAKGYAIFNLEGSEFGYGITLLAIERIDELDVYDNDIKASIQAKRDGVKLIPCKDYHYRTYPFNCYRFIDTQENRNALARIQELELE